MPRSTVVIGMGPRRIVEILIAADGPVCVRSLVDASVHKPTRSTVWVAAFRDETGRRVWKSTGLRDSEAALTLASEWEAAARRKRPAQGRVSPRSSERQVGLMTQKEVAAILRISERTVRQIEKTALAKLRRHPALRNAWREWMSGEVEESSFTAGSGWALTRAEVAAVYGLTRTPEERRAVTKLLALTQGVSARSPSGR